MASHVRHIPGNPGRGEPAVTVDGVAKGAAPSPAPQPKAAKKSKAKPPEG
jgi:hypothetical protein